MVVESSGSSSVRFGSTGVCELETELSEVGLRMTDTTILVPDASRSGTFRFDGERSIVRLGFGAMRLPGPGVWGPARDHDEAIRVLRRAVQLGVTFIDTADSYAPYISEDLIFEALHPYPAELVIATKAGLVRPGPDE